MIKRFLKYYKPHKKLFILDMSVASAAAILTVFVPIFTRNLIKTHIPDGNLQMIIQTMAIMGVFIIAKSIFTFIRVNWGHIMGVRMEYDMRSDIFSHIQKLSFTYFDNVKTGHIMSRISNDLNTIAEIAHHAPEDLIISIFTIVGAFTFMFLTNPALAAIALIPLPLMMLWGLTYGRKMKSGFRNVRKRIADINSSVENSVQGIREVKSYANEKLEIHKFGQVNTDFRLAKERMYRIMAVFFSGMNFLTDFYNLWVIGSGAYFIYLGKFGIADLFAFTLYINYIMTPIQRLVNFVEQLQQGAASFERFTEIMDIEPDIKDRKNTVDVKSISGKINFENVTFKYHKTNKDVLKNISLEVPSGKTIALVGESGAGKSTLVSLIPRFYEPQKGKILIDNIDMMDMKQKFLRKNIGIVQQNVFLFDSTIRDNILYGNPYAGEEELVDAAKKANILDFILTLPEGFDTLVGERGIKLSGGQKQRISIARVFLKNPPVLIFDEATSSLDTESEAYIQSAMEELSQNRTTMIIAHRLSTVKNADLIYVLQEGQIIETGEHDSLMQEKGTYFQLYTKNLL